MISIIVPVYKVEKFLDKCINRILNQTYKEFELILVNDGSPDNCPNICNEYAKKDNRIKVIHKDNGGLQSAIVAGLMIATSEYIAFVDSDDYFEPTILEEFNKKIERYKPDIISCEYNAVSLDDSIIYKHRGPKEGLYTREHNMYKDLKVFPNMYDWTFFTPARWNKCFKKDLLLLVLDYYINAHIRIGEDRIITYPAIMFSKTVYHINVPLYNYVQNELSIVHNFRPSNFDDWKTLCYEFNKVVNNSSYKIENRFEIYFCWLINMALSRIHDSLMSKKEKKKYLKDVCNDSFVRETLSKVKNCKKNFKSIVCYYALRLKIYHVFLYYHKKR